MLKTVFSRRAADHAPVRVALIATLATAPMANATSIVDLGTLGGNTSQGSAINAQGIVAGSSDVAGNSATHAFVYNPATGRLDVGTLGGSASQGLGINSSGQVTGLSSLSRDIATHSFVYTPGSGLRDVGTLSGGSYSQGNAINDSGQVAGASDTASGLLHGFVYTPGSGLRDVGTLSPGGVSFATSINSTGQVTGYSSVADGSLHAFVWSNGSMVDIGTLGGSTAQGNAINADGWVSGVSDLNGDASHHAFLYVSGALRDIGTLGGLNSAALALNGNGQVVGWADAASGGANAFLYSARTGMVDLNSLLPLGSGWHLVQAWGINDVGQVTGFGSYNGQQHAFLLSLLDVPEPAAWWSAAAGLALLLSRPRKRNAAER